MRKRKPSELRLGHQTGVGGSLWGSSPPQWLPSHVPAALQCYCFPHVDHKDEAHHRLQQLLHWLRCFSYCQMGVNAYNTCNQRMEKFSWADFCIIYNAERTRRWQAVADFFIILKPCHLSQFVGIDYGQIPTQIWINECATVFRVPLNWRNRINWSGIAPIEIT